MRKKRQPTVIMMKDGTILKNDRKEIIEGMDHYFVTNWILVAYLDLSPDKVR